MLYDYLLFKLFYLSLSPLYLYLLTRVNTIFGPKEERTLITGVHIVTDVFCSGCRTLIGWKYVKIMCIYVLYQLILLLS